MRSKINKILDDINKKKQELKVEYSKLKEKYGFKIVGRKIIWNKWRKEELKRYKKSIFETIFTAQIREILSIPFIYAMIIPAIILDLFLFIYQQTAIRLYRIPIVKRSDYIVFDRKDLAYLNILQKINCMYCSYFNWVVQYAVEVAWRTEKYWCPIKHARKKAWEHNWEEYFADYWNPEWFKETFCSIKEFEKLKNSKN
jgi:hypothetical protein